ncbi:MAG: hypothetical protein M1326_01895 [Cyanobacteria bacterium]|nr:hypothetical protein [Cyanobacteriota bacterium]
MILGFLSSLIAHAAIEVIYINYSLGRGITLVNHITVDSIYCALPIYIQVIILTIGTVGGLLCGQFFWRVVYIEKKYQSKNHK